MLAISGFRDEVLEFVVGAVFPADRSRGALQMSCATARLVACPASSSDQLRYRCAFFFQFQVRRRRARWPASTSFHPEKALEIPQSMILVWNSMQTLIDRSVLCWLAAKDDATTVLQVQASAAHGLAQQRPHGPDLGELEIQVFQLVSRESFPTRRRTGPRTEPVKESPDFGNGKPGFPSKGDDGQAELCVRRKITPAVLAESWWKNSNFFVKTDGRRAET